MSKLVVALYDAVAAMEELDPAAVDQSDPEQVDFYKTYRMLCNDVIYADSYLRI